MPRQVSDEEYAFLQGRRQIADFVESIYNDPTLTREAKALIKKKYPQMQIPDFDIEDRVEHRLAEERKAREDHEKAARDEKQAAEFNDVRTKTQKQYGFTDEAMDRLEKFMVEKNVGDYEVAATYMASKEPKPSEATYRDQYWNHDKAPGFADIAKDPEGWARKEILTSLQNEQERAKNGRF